MIPLVRSVLAEKVGAGGAVLLKLLCGAIAPIADQAPIAPETASASLLAAACKLVMHAQILALEFVRMAEAAVACARLCALAGLM